MVPFFEVKKEIPTKERIPNEETSFPIASRARFGVRTESV
jgi:hypothetical protein